LNWYKVDLKLRSWVASEWQADIIFGHLCWGMLYLYGQDKLNAFLHDCRQGQPPLLLSNGFPGDLLPVPLTGAHTFSRTATIADQRKQYKQFKEQKEIHYITLAEFNACLAGQPPQKLTRQVTGEIRRVTLKNQLNRNSGTTTPGGSLYNFEEHYIPQISIYMKLNEEFKPVMENLLGYLKDSGYGKRKSAGYGSIESLKMEHFEGFEFPPKPNGFVTLSNFVPAVHDPVKGRWSVVTKYGRMGEVYASEDHAFKKPLLMLAAGSTFVVAEQRDFYGRMVEGLSYYPETVHYAYALPVPMVVA